MHSKQQRDKGIIIIMFSTQEDLLKIKKSDTLVIYGSGYSIRTITSLEQEMFNSFDSIGFNYFSKSHIPTTYYFIREQSAEGGFEDENHLNFIEDLNIYNNETALILINMKKKNRSNSARWNLKLPLFIHEKKFFINEKCFWLDLHGKEVEEEIRYSKEYASEFFDYINKYDIFNDGIIHYNSTFSEVIHFAYFMRYNRIIFVGVDLYDSRYFWLEYDEDRPRLKKYNRDHSNTHTVSGVVCSISNILSKDISKEFFVHNEKSLLRNYFKKWEIKNAE